MLAKLKVDLKLVDLYTFEHNLKKRCLRKTKSYNCLLIIGIHLYPLPISFYYSFIFSVSLIQPFTYSH